MDLSYQMFKNNNERPFASCGNKRSLSMSVIKPRILHPWLFCEMESIINSIIAESVWHQLMKLNLGAAACQKFVFDIGKEIAHIAKDGVANNGDADSDFNSYQYLQGNEGVAHGFKMC